VLGLAGGADVALGLEIGFGTGIVSGVASNEVQNAVRSRQYRKRRPWLLAMDQLDRKVNEG
jgi:hypothetical protein